MLECEKGYGKKAEQSWGIKSAKCMFLLRAESAVLSRMGRAELPEMWHLSRDSESKAMSHMDIWGKSISAEGT